MKKNSLVLMAILTSCSVFSQEVVATQGDSYTGTSGSIDFTIGEVVIDTGTDGVSDITQGFHQPSWNYLGVFSHSSSYEALIYPNPTTDVVSIKTADFEDVSYKLYDATGRLVLEGTLYNEITPLDLTHYATGTYSITLAKEGENLKTFKLIKLY